MSPAFKTESDRSNAEVATSFDIGAVQIDQEGTIERCATNAGSTIVARAVLQTQFVKSVDRLA